MRSCDEILELISAALDGALTGDEQTALDEHLSRCPACSALFDELKSLREASAELEDVPAPDGFAGRVMDAIAAEPAQEQSGNTDNVVSFPVKKCSRTPWKGWAATAAVVAVVVLGAVALPGQLGAGGLKANSGAAADCAAPASENASASPAEENGTAEVDFFAITSADDNGGARAGGAAAESESAADQPAEAKEDCGQADRDPTTDQSISIQATSLPSSSDSPTVFCGVLTLTGESLPDGLEDYAHTEDAEGNRTYEVPADFFFSYLQTLEEEQPNGFSYEAGQEDAAYGLIVVGGDAR